MSIQPNTLQNPYYVQAADATTSETSSSHPETLVQRTASLSQIVHTQSSPSDLESANRIEKLLSKVSDAKSRPVTREEVAGLVDTVETELGDSIKKLDPELQKVCGALLGFAKRRVRYEPPQLPDPFSQLMDQIDQTIAILDPEARPQRIAKLEARKTELEEKEKQRDELVEAGQNLIASLTSLKEKIGKTEESDSLPEASSDNP